MRQSHLWVILIFCLTGMAGSFLATQQYFQILEHGFEKASFCAVNEYINCDVAYASEHAKLFGLPVAWFGFLFYLLSFLLSLWILWKKKGQGEAASLGWLLSVGGLGFTLQKAYLSFFVLEVLCLICAAMYLVNLVLFFSWHSYLKIGLRNFAGLSFRPQWKTLGALTITLFGIGTLGVAQYQEGLSKKTKLNISKEEMLRFHFRQSEYLFEPDIEHPAWGNPQAKVTLVEFSDFQCPFCKEAAFYIKPILTDFKNKVRFYYYHYPIDPACNENIQFAAHDQACLAAQAAICAGQKNDFWNYHDDLFRNQKKLSRELFLQLAKQRNWNLTEFEKCLDANETVAKVKKDIAVATQIHISGTPTILLNNRLVRYWRDPETLRAILKEEIKISRRR